MIDVPKIIKEKTGKEFVEVDNCSDKPVLVSLCRSKTSNNLFLHIGKRHGWEIEIAPGETANVEIMPAEG